VKESFYEKLESVFDKFTKYLHLPAFSRYDKEEDSKKGWKRRAASILRGLLFNPEEVGGTFPPNVSYTAVYARRQCSSQSSL
jgi:hypothetical protein